MEKCEERKSALQEENERLNQEVQWRQNAIHLAAAVLIQIEAKDETITNVKECEGCDKCNGIDGCYLIEILKDKKYYTQKD